MDFNPIIQEYIQKIEYFSIAERYYDFGYDHIADDATDEARDIFFRENVPLVRKELENVNNAKDIAHIFEITPSNYAVQILPAHILHEQDFAYATRGSFDVYPHLAEELRNSHFLLSSALEKLDHKIYYNILENGETTSSIIDKATALFDAIPESISKADSFQHFIAQNSAYFSRKIPTSFFTPEKTETVLESLSHNKQTIVLEAVLSKLPKESLSEEVKQIIVNKIPLGYSKLNAENRDNKELAIQAIRKDIVNAVQVPEKYFEDIEVQTTFLKSLARLRSPSYVGSMIFWDDHDTLLDITKKLPQIQSLNENITSDLHALKDASDIAIMVLASQKNVSQETVKPKI